jgi:hypothetical protein
VLFFPYTSSGLLTVTASVAPPAQYRADVLNIIAILKEKTRQIQDTVRRITQRFMSHPEQTEQLTEAQIAAEVKLA